MKPLPDFKYFVNFLFALTIARSSAALSLQKQWALLNVTSVASSGSDDLNKNILFSDSALYSLYSPIYEVYAQLIEAKNVDENDATENQTLTNNGCSNYINANLPENYIVLVSRGVCTFERKVQIAVANKALAVIIYNNDQNVITMFIKNTSIPSIMVSEYVGNLLKKLVTHSTVFVSIKPGPVEFVQSGSLPSRSSVYFVAFAFLSVVLVTFIWLTVYYIQKFRYINTKKRLEDKLKKATVKALAKMEVRKISNGDKEITETCAICLENYQENDQIRELPCGHYFHQKDVDLWLLEHRNCPMCKINIIQACGIELKRSQNFYQKLLRIRRIFRNSAVEAANEAEVSRASADMSLESVSVSTNANNFQISHNDPELNINEINNDNINSSKSPTLQATMLNSMTSNNHQGEEDNTHSNRTNKIDV